MKFSIIIPTYNEENDIAMTLDALVKLDYPEKEIIIVDDSTDRTPTIVRGYADRGVRLIHPGGGGRCEARNNGILAATGDVVCILNADVQPRPDFLRRLVPHYENGADYVLVQSNVINQTALFARYIQATHLFEYEDLTQTGWTEGFSGRRALIMRAGLFPTGFATPLVAGEDWVFVSQLEKIGARKAVDDKIVVDHIAPATFAEYWRIRKGRGAGSPQVRRFLQGWSFPQIMLRSTLRIGMTALSLLTVLPVLLQCWRVTKYSQRGRRDLLPFLFAWLIEKVAFHVGEWQSLLNIMAKEKIHVATKRYNAV